MATIKNLDTRFVAIGAVAYAIVSQIVNSAVAVLTMPYYTNPAYFGIWSKLMMPTAGPPPASFFVISFVFDLIVGVIFAVFYAWVSGLLGNGILKKSSVWSKAGTFALVLFAISAIPGTLAMILILNLPLGLIGAWAISAAVIYYLSGLVFAKLEK